MEALKILAVIAISLFALLAVFLISNAKARVKGFVWLGVFFLLLALNFIDGLFLLNGYYQNWPRLAFWEDSNALLYGPLIYFFSLQVNKGFIVFRPKMLFHFLPFIIFVFFILYYHTTSSLVETKALLVEIVTYRTGPRVLLGILPIFAHLLTYMVVSYKLLIRHKEQLKHYYSSIEISWAFEIIKMILLIFSISFAITFVQYLGKKDLFPVLLFLLNILTVFLLVRLLLQALKKPMFQTVKNTPIQGLSEQETQAIKTKIEKLLTEKKCYMNPQLTVNDLANELGVSKRVISHTINATMADNFYDLINEYRIKEAQRILIENKDSKFTVLEVLYEVGYNSKSSFNTQFKKKTGMTPSEYRRLKQK